MANEFTLNDTADRFESLERRIAELERAQAEHAGLLHQQVLLTNRVMNALESVAEWKDLTEAHATKIRMLCEFAEQTGKTLVSHRTQLDRLSSVQPFPARGAVN